MSMTCPNCRHVRSAADAAPAWQCPACGKAYNKGAGAAVDPHYGRPVAPARPASNGGGTLKVLLLLALVAGAAWLFRPLWQGVVHPPVAQAAGRGAQPDVYLYATEWCGYCAKTRAFFAAQGVRYTELDIEKSSIGAEGYRQLGGNGVPVILVGDTVVHGFDESRLRALLAPWFKG